MSLTWRSSILHLLNQHGCEHLSGPDTTWSGCTQHGSRNNHWCPDNLSLQLILLNIFFASVMLPELEYMCTRVLLICRSLSYFLRRKAPWTCFPSLRAAIPAHADAMLVRVKQFGLRFMSERNCKAIRGLHWLYPAIMVSQVKKYFSGISSKGLLAPKRCAQLQ